MQSFSPFYKAGFALLLSLSVCACQESAPPPSRQERMADTFCQCTQQLLNLNQQAEALLQDSSKRLQVEEQLRSIQEEYQRTKECSGNIIARHGKLSKEDFPLFKTALAQKCPGLANQDDLIREMLGD